VSSTARGTVREALDDYPTPRWCVHRLLEAVAFPGLVWVEPCAGAGSIIRAVNEVRSDVRWIANELNELYLPALRSIPNVAVAASEDARTLDIGEGPSVIITNPPFVYAQDILLQCLKVKSATAVFLERLNWCCGPRRDLFRELKPSTYVLPDRPSFTPDGKTDSIEYAFFVFDGLGKFKILNDTPKEVRTAEKNEKKALAA